MSGVHGDVVQQESFLGLCQNQDTDNLLVQFRNKDFAFSNNLTVIFERWAGWLTDAMNIVSVCVGDAGCNFGSVITNSTPNHYFVAWDCHVLSPFNVEFTGSPLFWRSGGTNY
jgi:hypothetical protein